MKQVSIIIDGDLKPEALEVWQQWCIENGYGADYDMPTIGQMIHFLRTIKTAPLIRIDYDRSTLKWNIYRYSVDEPVTDFELSEALYSCMREAFNQ